MEKSEIKKEFASLYGIVALNKQVEDMKLFGSVMCDMMDVLVESHPNTAEKFLEKLESVKWYNYVTRDEAEKTIREMKPSVPFDFDDWIDMIDSVDGMQEKEPEYNRYALWTVMGMIYSDSGNTIAKLLGMDEPNVSDQQFVRALYLLAMDKLNDEDGVFEIRKYFSL